MARVVLALLAIGACLLLMQSAARIGFSRLLTRYAIGANSLAAADQAIQLTPSDAEAHRARATVLNRLHRPAEARVSLETATSLRSQQATLWLELGETREELGDPEGALAAFDQAVRYAPYYGETHWQRGNLLLRTGRYDEAFADLRRAATSDRRFLPNLIDLAWGLSGGVPKRTEELIKVSDDQDRLEFARFLARKGQGSETLNQVGLLNAPVSWENNEELVQLLVAAKSFREAFSLWSGHETSAGLVNGMFEDPFVFDDCCFHWVISERHGKAKFALDVSEKFSGQKSLQVTFAGDWDSTAPVLSQTIVVEPEHRYRLNFALKTKDLVTGGPLRIVLTDATNDKILAQSETLPQSTGSWQQLNVEFTAGAEAAVNVSLKRESCASSPCPIFGTVWLDEFWFEKL